jgi:tRNA pseudouridine38-40 synthase
MPERRNIKLVIAYNGAAYHGWQRQAAGLETVQEHVEKAAVRMLNERITVSGAGRTDAGVHAAGQVANLRTSNLVIPMKGLRRGMNSRLPRDISIRSAVEVPMHFQASRSAVGKTYQYRIHVAPMRPVDLHGQVYHYWRSLDVDRMRAAGVRLIGTHDFRGFASSAEIRENTVRTITRCDVVDTGAEVHVSVQGTGFLYHMVRNIVGTLIDVGRGYWEPHRINTILTFRDRRNAGPTAPPDGLTLQCVHYNPEDLRVEKTAATQRDRDTEGRNGREG